MDKNRNLTPRAIETPWSQVRRLKRTRWICIDPGISGGVAVAELTDYSACVLTHSFSLQKGTAQDWDDFRAAVRAEGSVFVEALFVKHPSSALKLAFSTGWLLGSLEELSEVVWIPSARWMGALGLKGTAAARQRDARMRASRIVNHPLAASDDGECDAVLMADFLARTWYSRGLV